MVSSDLTNFNKMNHYEENIFYYGSDNDAVTDVTKHISKGCLNKLDVIFLSTKDSPYLRLNNLLLNEKGWIARGYYNKWDNYTFVKINLFYLFQTTETLTHEIGHAVWKEMPKSLKNEWNYISRNSLTYPSVYSKTKITEDFAESFAFWYLNDTIDLSKERIEFMARIVDKECNLKTLVKII